MIQGFKDSRIQGFKRNALKLQRTEGLGEIVSVLFRDLPHHSRIPKE
jgi:hypothetical protein